MSNSSDNVSSAEAEGKITLAVAKGRVLRDTLPLLERVGITPDEDLASTRRLIIGTSEPGLSIVVVRSADVPTYVEFGAADFGVVGKDVLIESESADIYEVLDLGIARCRLSVAQPRDAVSLSLGGRRTRVATKYPVTARRYFASRGIQANVIKLYGSMELAPLSGLADQIVDLVDTGSTLKANDLVEIEKIMDISTRLVANKAAMKMKGPRMKDVIGRIKGVIEAAS